MRKTSYCAEFPTFTQPRGASFNGTRLCSSAHLLHSAHVDSGKGSAGHRLANHRCHEHPEVTGENMKEEEKRRCPVGPEDRPKYMDGAIGRCVLFI